MQRSCGPSECICKAEYSVAVTFSEVLVIAGDGYLWARVVGTVYRATQTKR